MPIVNEYNKVKDIYNDAVRRRICLPVFAAEDRETIEAILSAGLEIGEELNFYEIPIIITWTTRYPMRPQMTKVLACGDPYLGTKLMLSDLEILMSSQSCYSKLLVMPHLDHFIPWLDYDIVKDFFNNFASILVDASEKSEQENIQITSDFVEKFKGKFIIEGVVDSIKESGTNSDNNNKTSIEKARKFLEKTGVDIIVPNVGTEHRSTSLKVKYDEELAYKISKEVGNILSLHGTSSLKENDLNNLAEKGFIKANIFTALALMGGQTVAENILNNLGSIFNEKQIDRFVRDGILNENIFNFIDKYKNIQVNPRLEYLANVNRRDSWFNAVKSVCKKYLKLLHYENFANSKIINNKKINYTISY